MRFVAYCRVSTDRQAEEGFGLDVQRQAIRSWAKTNGHRVVAWCSDEGVSGSNGVEDREALPEALTLIKTRRVDGLLVARLDRLSRKLTDLEAMLAKVWAMDAVVFSTDVGEVPEDDPDDPMRTALRQMIGVFAQLERGMIAARLRAGRREKHSKGGYAYGAPPFGYRAESGELIAIPDEQDTLARMHELREAGSSLRAIGEALHAEGRRPRRGDHWHPKVIAAALARAEIAGATTN